MHTTIVTPEPEESASTSAPSSDGAAATEFDVIAYNSDLRERLIEAEPISEAEMNALAQARLDSIREFLISTAALEAARVLQGAAVTVAEDEDGWLVLEFGLGSG